MQASSQQGANRLLDRWAPKAIQSKNALESGSSSNASTPQELRRLAQFQAPLWPGSAATRHCASFATSPWQELVHHSKRQASPLAPGVNQRIESPKRAQQKSLHNQRASSRLTPALRSPSVHHFPDQDWSSVPISSPSRSDSDFDKCLHTAQAILPSAAEAATSPKGFEEAANSFGK